MDRCILWIDKMIISEELPFEPLELRQMVASWRAQSQTVQLVCSICNDPVQIVLQLSLQPIISKSYCLVHSILHLEIFPVLDIVDFVHCVEVPVAIPIPKWITEYSKGESSKGN